MSSYTFFNIAILSVSLFNTIILLWLGFTIVLNAEQRTGGVILLGLGLLVGGLFFISHSAIIGQEFTLNVDGLNFWWRIGWIPVTFSPLAWYIVVLWYAGFWSQPRSSLYRRHIGWLTAVIVLMTLFTTLLLIGNLLPDYEEIVQLDLSNMLLIGGVPAVFALFPLQMITCILLAIDALRHPAPTHRLMGDLARKRSRPYLMGAALVLFVVSLVVTYFIIQVVINAQTDLRTVQFETIAIYDLALEALIALATLLIGQAIVAYEVFTGKILPRRGFFRQWRNIVVIAAIFSVFLAWSLNIQLRTIYIVLLTTLLLVVSHSLYSWHEFVERDNFMRHLRPFVSGQNLISSLLDADQMPTSNAEALFRSVCRELLNAEQARLIPLGYAAPLVESSLAYPSNSVPSILLPNPLSAEVTLLDPLANQGYQAVIPLWSERGLSGALLISRKQDDGLFTQEEFEIAQTSGERIIDMLAGEQITRRLIQLERKRLVETRLIDMDTRRMLHDEILPAIHTTILKLNGTGAADAAIHDLTNVHQQISGLIQQKYHAPRKHHQPFNLVTALREIIADHFTGNFDTIAWDTPQEVFIEPLSGEVILAAAHEILRNVALHARGENNIAVTVSIQVRQTDSVMISIQDNGVGFKANKSDRSGSGNGLVLHSTLLTVIGGYLSVEASPTGGTLAVITVPNSVTPD